MRKSFYYTNFIMSLLVFAWSGPSWAKDASDAQAIRKALDEICGDSWCEGAFDFRFQRVRFHPERNETELRFQMSQDYPLDLGWTQGQSFKATIQERSFNVRCVLPGYSDYDSIMQSKHRLRQDFYVKLTECIVALEDRLAQAKPAKL